MKRTTMIKALLLSLLLVLAGCSTAGQVRYGQASGMKAQASSIQKKVDIMDMVSSTVVVNRGGSGVVIRKDNEGTWILTAWHVVNKLVGTPQFTKEGVVFPKMKPVPVSYGVMDRYGGRLTTISYEGKIHTSSALGDLAIVIVPDRIPAKVAELGSVPLAFGDGVVVVGHPLSLSYTVTNGIVSNPMRIVPKITGVFMQFSAPVTFGNSGGPIFNERGRVVGIVLMGFKHIALSPTLGFMKAFVKVSLPEGKNGKEKDK